MALSTSKEECTGCSACANECPHDCITMRENEFGFFYPEINNSECKHCGKCDLICPVYKPMLRNVDSPKCFAAFALDETKQKMCSSGGVFAELARKVLEKNGVVYGATYGEGFVIHHIRIDDESDLSKCIGAKYAQSNMRDVFSYVKKDLVSGKIVLFSGTPCQVAGLKRFVADFDHNLISVDFICHGVPSPRVWNEYVKYRNRKDGFDDLININMRSKISGWANYEYSIRFDYKNGCYLNKSYDDIFMNLFLNDYINNIACEKCKFKPDIHRYSDIILGDFWGVERIYPDMDCDKGISAVIARTSKGYALLFECINSIEYRKVEYDDIVENNPALIRSFSANSKRLVVLNKAIVGRFDEIDRKIVKRDNSRKRVVAKIKSIVARIKHEVN